ncbi:MAG: DNA polymerase III subunit delta [Flavobacteriales bacterium]|nr:DNA polymerase III subunit delta [Flavobacteriales bacterium]
MEYKTLINELKGKQYKPIYFLQGDEAYFIDKIAKFIETNVLEEHERDFNQTIFYGKDTTVDAILATAKRFPMMAERQVVIVREAQHLKNQLGEFKAYLQQPLTSTVLVFCYKYGKLDGRKEISKQFAKHCLFTSDQIKDYKVPDWISTYVKSKGLLIDQRSAILLAEYLGSGLSKISGEIDKLSIIVDKGTNITPDIIQKNIGISKEYNIFELQNALLKRDVLKANVIIKYFASNPKNHPAVLIIPQLFSLFQKIMKLHFAKNKGNDQALAREIGVHPFFVKEYKAASQFYNPKRLANIIEWTREADLQSKGVGVANLDTGEILKQLVFRILH